MKYTPKYDLAFKPFAVELEKFRKEVKADKHKSLKICVERNKGNNYILTESIFAEAKKAERNYAIIERLVKAALWVAGGYKIYVSGDDYIYERLKADYTLSGARKFDVDFMSGVYERDFEVVKTDEENFPEYSPCRVEIGGHLDGCRIGFDAGGSDRKVSAVVDGKVVYSEEVVWQPKLSTDYRYQYDGIKSAFLTAASKMPRVDAVGVSSAGVYIDNKIMVSSLFINIPKRDYKPHVQTMYLDIAKELGYPIEVANDGDVTALAGAMELNAVNVLYLLYRHGARMNKRFLLGYILTEQAFGEYLERRHGDYFHVALRHLFPVHAAERFAGVRVPRYLIERRTERFAPKRRFRNYSVKPDARTSRVQNPRRYPCGFYVRFLAARRPYAHNGSYPRKLGYSRFHYRRNVVIDVSPLPIVILFLFSYVAVGSNLAVLVAHQIIHVEPPLLFERAPFRTPSFKVLFYFRGKLVVKNLFTFFHRFYRP